MKLSDLLKQKLSPGGGFSNQVLQNSINKSSPGFKQTTMNLNGTPVATDVNTPPTVPPPEPIRDGAGTPIATPVDWNANYAYRASQGDTSAQDWIDQNTIDEQVQTPTTDSGIDFSTPTTNVAYSMEKLNELYGTRSPEDLWALRQKLRLQESQASAGMLPASEYMDYQGLPGLEGQKGYTYDQQMGVNKSTADIFSTQVADLDKFMDDYSKGQSANGSSGGYSFGSNPALDVILGSGKFTKDQKGLIIGAIQSGQDPNTVILNQARSLMANPIATEVSKTQQGVTQLREVQSALADYYANNGDTSLFKGGYEKVIQKLGKTSDPKLAVINSRIAKALQKYRNAVSGTAYSVQEGADIASIFPGINKGKELNDALVGAGIESLQSDIDTAYAEVLGADIYNSLKSGGNNTPSTSSDADTFQYNGQTYKKNPDGSATLVSFSQVGSGTNKAPKVVAGYDISSYATDPNHERSVASIYQRTPPFKTASDIDMVIRKVAPKSKITGQMVATAANAYGVDPKMVYAIMLQDSSLGTAGMGARNNNPGNIGQYDNLGRPVAGYQTLQGGVNAVAKWLSKKKVQPGGNYA